MSIVVKLEITDVAGGDDLLLARDLNPHFSAAALAKPHATTVIILSK